MLGCSCTSLWLKLIQNSVNHINWFGYITKLVLNLKLDPEWRKPNPSISKKMQLRLEANANATLWLSGLLEDCKS
ncbi:hypothetical protein RIF29_14603 [Crotalaria pallida]|uniref:Uncharacterized protein n=1 Tax=Crotalaria pallida TaxID=3830 RepID=A0AAN9IBT0_CROPI